MLDATREVLIATGYGILALACVDAKEAIEMSYYTGPSEPGINATALTDRGTVGCIQRHRIA